MGNKSKSVAIVGLGNSCSEYLMSRIRSEKFDEVWAINSISGVIYHDKCFMMDPPSRFLDTPNAGNQTDIMQDRLTKKMNIPIYSYITGFHAFDWKLIAASTTGCLRRI